MDISWAWLIIGLVAGAPLGLLTMGALVEGRVLDASSAGYKRGLEHGGEAAFAAMRAQWQNTRDERETRWVTLVLDLSKEVERLKAAVEQFSPAKMAACPVCSPETEQALADVDLGQKGA